MALVCNYKGCTVIIALSRSIRKHYQKSHGLEGKQLPFQWHFVTTQQLNKSLCRTYFRVYISQQSLSPLQKDWFEALKLDIHCITNYPSADATDICNINTFLV